MKEQSDNYSMSLCKICGLPAFVDKHGAFKECRLCLKETIGMKDSISRISIPYGTKLVMQEFMAMGICSRILTEPFEVKEK